MIKFEIILSDETVRVLQEAKSKAERQADGYYISYEQFIKIAILHYIRAMLNGAEAK